MRMIFPPVNDDEIDTAIEGKRTDFCYELICYELNCITIDVKYKTDAGAAASNEVKVFGSKRSTASLRSNRCAPVKTF
jgi:hypothetical protein